MMSRSYDSTKKKCPSSSDTAHAHADADAVVEYSAATTIELWGMLQYICSRAPMVGRMHIRSHISIILHECARIIQHTIQPQHKYQQQHQHSTQDLEQWLIYASRCQHVLLTNCTRIGMDAHVLLQPLYQLYHMWTKFLCSNHDDAHNTHTTTCTVLTHSTILTCSRYLFSSMTMMMRTYPEESVEYLYYNNAKNEEEEEEEDDDGILHTHTMTMFLKAGFRVWRMCCGHHMQTRRHASQHNEEKLRSTVLHYFSACMTIGEASGKLLGLASSTSPYILDARLLPTPTLHTLLHTVLTPDVLRHYFFDTTTTNNNNNTNNTTCDVSNDVTQLYIVHLWKLISLRSIRQIKTKYNNKNIMVQFNLLIKILFGNKY